MKSGAVYSERPTAAAPAYTRKRLAGRCRVLACCRCVARRIYRRSFSTHAILARCRRANSICVHRAARRGLENKTVGVQGDSRVAGIFGPFALTSLLLYRLILLHAAVLLTSQPASEALTTLQRKRGFTIPDCRKQCVPFYLPIVLCRSQQTAHFVRHPTDSRGCLLAAFEHFAPRFCMCKTLILNEAGA